MVARNDEFFDFDVFQDLDLLQPVDESCVSTRLTTTTNAPPTDYCKTIRISGSENHYGAVGTYHKSGTLNGKNKVSFEVNIPLHPIPHPVLHRISILVENGCRMGSRIQQWRTICFILR